MASFLHLCPTILAFLLTALLISPAYSLTCTSQTFTSNVRYTNCTDLPTLKAFLHWSYNPTNSSLSVVFIASPPKSDGWVAWAINPTGTGMAGSQALLAYKASNGSMAVETYNISSYTDIVASKLSFDVWDKKAEFSNGSIRIFATLAVPENMTKFNQVWQVGSSVKNGLPEKHEFKQENLNAKGPLELITEANTNAPAAAPNAGGNNNTTDGAGQSRNDTGGGCASLLNTELHGLLLLLGILILGF